MSDSLQSHGRRPARLLCAWWFSRQEYWSGLLWLPPGDRSNPEIKPRSPALQADSLPTVPPAGECVEECNYTTPCETHRKRPWCWERLKVGREGDDRGWDGWMTSLTQWTWLWASSRSWWWTGKPGMLQSMGSQRVGHDWATELNWCTTGGFPGGSDGKESTCIVGDLGSIPGLGRSPEGGHRNPLQHSCLENLPGQRNLVGYSPWGHKESYTTERLCTAYVQLVETA